MGDIFFDWNDTEKTLANIDNDANRLKFLINERAKCEKQWDYRNINPVNQYFLTQCNIEIERLEGLLRLENLPIQTNQSNKIPLPDAAPNPFDDLNKDNYFFTDKVEAFKVIEIELVKVEYLSQDGKWIAKQNQLVALIHILYELKYLRQVPKSEKRNALNRYKRFFKTRYNIDISKAFQPTQFKRSLKAYKTEYHFIPEIDKI